MEKKKVVFICSPYRGDEEINKARAIRYCTFAFKENAVPYAPHLHNTQFLSELIPEDRKQGIELGLELLLRVDELWCFGNVITEGMAIELKFAADNKIPIRHFTYICEEILENKEKGSHE